MIRWSSSRTCTSESRFVNDLQSSSRGYSTGYGTRLLFFREREGISHLLWTHSLFLSQTHCCDRFLPLPSTLSNAWERLTKPGCSRLWWVLTCLALGNEEGTFRLLPIAFSPLSPLPIVPFNGVPWGSIQQSLRSSFCSTGLLARVVDSSQELVWLLAGNQLPKSLISTAQHLVSAPLLHLSPSIPI